MTIKNSTNPINAKAKALYDATVAHMPEEARANVPAYDSADDFPIGAVMSNFGTWNAFSKALIEYPAGQYIKDGNFSNPYSPLEKGTSGMGGFDQHIFVEEAEIRDLDPNKGGARELQRVPEHIRAVYAPITFAAQYPAPTINDMWAETAFGSAEKLVGFFDRITKSMGNSWIADDRDMYTNLILSALFAGAIRQVQYIEDADETKDARNLAKKIKQVHGEITGGNRRDYNSEGVKTGTPADQMFMLTDAVTMANLDVELFSQAFQLPFVQLPGHSIVIDSFNSIDWPHFRNWMAKTGQMREFTVAQKAWLDAGHLKALLFDGEGVQAKLKRMGTASWRINNSEDVQGVLNVRKSYYILPWSNMVAITDGTPWPLSTTLDFKVTELVRNEQTLITQFNLTPLVPLVGFTFVTDNPLNLSVTIDGNGQVIGDDDATLKASIVVDGVTHNAPDLVLAALVEGEAVTFA